MRRWARFRRLFGPDPSGDVDAELAFHLEMRIREIIEQGEPPDRARQLALQRFGDYDQSRSECLAIDERRKRHMTRTEYLTELRQDVGYAVRMLRRTPGFAFVAVLTLALGIGANSAIFSVVYGVLLESLPYRSADRLYQPRMLYPDGTPYTSLSAADFMSVRDGNRVFEQVEAYATGVFTLLGAGEPQEVRGARVSDGLFDMLGLRLTIGRGFAVDEHRPGQGNFAVLDQGFWQRAFGGDPAVLGRKVTVGGNPYTIVGVLAPDARLPDSADMYAPLVYDETFSASTAQARRSEYLDVIGRAREGVTAAQVEDDLKRLGQQLQTTFPDSNGTLTFTSASLRTMIVGDVQKPLFMLLGAVALVLLVACANVANLLLARASARQAELAVRIAMGAGRGRLLRQLLTESLVLGLAGGAAGLLIAYWATRALVNAQPADIPRLEHVGLNGTVLLFTLGISLVTGLAFGLLPAVQATGARLSRSLREGGRSGAPGKSAHRVRATLVIAEMALSVVLLMGAGLLIRSFVQMTRVAPGFSPDHAMTFRITLQGDEYARAQQIRDRVAAFESRLRALPGVSAVGLTTVLPLSGLGSVVDFAVVGAPPPPPDVNAEIGRASVTPEYFATIGAPLRRGRGFTAQDDSRGPAVAVVNEAAVRRWFKDRDPIGQQVEMSGVRREVIGVVADVRQRRPGQPVAAQLFTPYAQLTTRSVRFIVRSAGDPISLAPSIRAAVRTLDPNLAVTDFTPLTQLVASSVARPRFYTSLLALFAGVALALAATGIFGVMSYAVAQRGREISIRMALGARANQVLRMIVGRAVALAGAGALIGVVAAMALGRVIQSQLFGVGILDPITLGAVIILLIGSAAAASFLPARRAAAMDPASVLRES
jgi:putative ABC transport system permease protein